MATLHKIKYLDIVRKGGLRKVVVDKPQGLDASLPFALHNIAVSVTR